jgi:hypothetical protein
MSSAFSHTPSSGNIIVNLTGTYEVTYIVVTQNGQQFGLAVNGTLLPGGIYGADTGGRGIPGQIVFSATAGDIITIQHLSSGPANLLAMNGGTQPSVNASLSIRRVVP